MEARSATPSSRPCCRLSFGRSQPARLDTAPSPVSRYSSGGRRKLPPTRIFGAFRSHEQQADALKASCWLGAVLGVPLWMLRKGCRAAERAEVERLLVEHQATNGSVRIHRHFADWIDREVTGV